MPMPAKGPLEAPCDCRLSIHNHDGGVCGRTIRYRNSVRAGPGKKHLCSQCVKDWQTARLVRLVRSRKAYRGKCGHVVSRPGVDRCRACYNRAPRRREVTDQYSAAHEAFVRLVSSGEEFISIKGLAKKAGISRDAARRYLALKDKPEVRPLVVERHPGQGTESGFTWHRQIAKDTPCRSCRNAYNRAQARRRRNGARQIKTCGTAAAYKRGCRCADCREGNRLQSEKQRRAKGVLTHSEAAKLWRASRPGRPVPPARCGDKNGYLDHRAVGEETCRPCRDAWNADQRARKARRQAKG